MSMEERVPPTTDDDDPQNLFRSGTYVVQVPKDQIYRVPPPENALIAERHRPPGEAKKSFRSRCLIFFILLCVAAVIIGIAVGLSARFFNAKNPTFHIEKLVVTNSSHSRPHYKIIFIAQNPNSRTSITYKDGGRASLSYKTHEIANGDCPTFSQGHKDSTVFVVALNGSQVALPAEIKSSMAGKRSKAHPSLALSISMDYPINRKVLFFQRGKRLNVACDITVDTLAKGTRVLSQKCDS